MRFRQILTENLLLWRLEKEPKKFTFVALLEPNVTPPGFNVVLNMDTSEANMALNMDRIPQFLIWHFRRDIQRKVVIPFCLLV